MEAQMDIKSLKLYHYPASRSARVKWALCETVGDKFEEVVVKVYNADQHSPEYLAKNPNHNVPTLEIGWDDGTTQIMLESGAMVAWLAETYPEKQLSPSVEDASKRADYQYMMYFGASWVDMMLWHIRMHEHLIADAERDQRTIDRYRQKFAAEIEPQLMARLEKHPFICGDTFTAADIIMGHNVTWAKGYRMCQQSIFRKYIKTLAERPAFRSAFSDTAGFQLKPPSSAEGLAKFNG